MTDKKISELTSITGANVSDANDVLPIVDTSVATTKKITRAELFKSVSSVDINGGTIDGTVIGGSTPAAGTFTSADLAAIAETKAVTAVDVFVYDTSKDSDGGAWRKRTQHTSWYNETLNTATRGARREFPAVAVIVAEASKITIYDGDDPSLPMWMVFNEGVGNALWLNTNVDPTSVVMLNGIMCVCQNGSGAGGFNRMFFIEDTTSLMIETTVKYNVMPIAQRNRGSGITVNGSFSAGLVNRNINDVAITVLPDAPIDPATGLPVPTIAVATEGGVSVIKDDGTVVSGGELNSGWNVTGLFFDGDATLWATEGTAYSGLQRMSVPPFSSVADIGDPINGGYGYPYYNPVTANTFGAPQNAPKLRQGGVLYGKAMSAFGNTLVAGNAAGISKVLHNSASQLTSLVNYTTSTYNTGWMNGDIKGAFLSSTNTASLVGGTDDDRSVNGNDLTVNGTITRSPVATGAELVAYSGFSSSNYLEGTDASYVDTLYALGWEQTSGVWGFKRGVVSAAPIDGLSITGSTLKIAGTKPKALIRLTATVPTADQLAKIEADERPLFQENAACTIAGTSDAVTALAHDPDTGLLHVGSSYGRSVFQGLRRVSNTTTAVGTAISASNSLVVEE